MTGLLKLLFLQLVLLLSPMAHAQSAEQKGLQIATSAANAQEGYGDSVADGEMVLVTESGRTSTRRFVTKSIEGGASGPSGNLIIFEWPGDVRDTALLTHSYETRPDDQWLYLPSVGRVKRISSSARSGSFMGSEFAYEDMVDQGVDEFDHLWLRDEPCPGAGGTCHVVARTPKVSSGYSRQVVWFDAARLYIRQIQYFDRAGRHLKTLTASGHRQHLGRYWRPGKLVMVNHLTGKRTDLNWSNHRFRTGVSANDFSVQGLRRQN